ncbi:hypothetical protein BK026_01825 [Alteromonas sp. V450]|uniref:hypothetical protein n=1 Tax=Alteromonas sp. V450 TaxID=1912139 RepID=UPI0008FF119B|nr:hypothetical protein [Alteromonas sp. V450]OJF67624.1 hypothetical protein BK026_01825 [Alteromonas sp. V450]
MEKNNFQAILSTYFVCVHFRNAVLKRKTLDAKTTSILCFLTLALALFFSIELQAKEKEDYFDERAGYFKVLYSKTNYLTTLAVYRVGKPSYNILTNANDKLLDIGTGLKIGGPKGALASLIVNQGRKGGLALLSAYLETPQQVTYEYAAAFMKEGLEKYKVNYSLYRKGLGNLSADEEKRFRENQAFVDLLGDAKELYLSSKDAKQAPLVYEDGGDLLSSVESVFTKNAHMSKTLLTLKIADILIATTVNLNDYEPFVSFNQQFERSVLINSGDEKTTTNKVNASSTFSPLNLNFTFDNYRTRNDFEADFLLIRNPSISIVRRKETDRNVLDVKEVKKCESSIRLTSLITLQGETSIGIDLHTVNYSKSRNNNSKANIGLALAPKGAGCEMFIPIISAESTGMPELEFSDGTVATVGDPMAWINIEMNIFPSGQIDYKWGHAKENKNINKRFRKRAKASFDANREYELVIYGHAESSTRAWVDNIVIKQWKQKKINRK